MSILSEIITALQPLNIQTETAVFSGKAPDEYIILTPLSDSLENYADNMPQSELQEVRLSLFSKHNYLARKNAVTRILLNNDFTITDRRYIGYEEDTKYFHYAIDIMKAYEVEE